MYPCKVLVGEIMYSSSEQAYQHEYAVEAGDDVTAQAILEAEDGYEYKHVTRGLSAYIAPLNFMQGRQLRPSSS